MSARPSHSVRIRSSILNCEVIAVIVATRYRDRMRLPLASLILSAALGGCLATGTADVQYSGDVAVSTPDLVEVSPGVQVVADYDDSVFYSDGYYWRYDGGGWYRSSNYAGGFVYWNAPPAAVISINDPGRYRHYRPSGYQPRHQPYRRPEPIVRDHREPMRPAPQPEVRAHREPERREAPAPAPVVRDHREERHEERAPAPAPVVRDHRDDHDHDHKHDHDHH